MKTREHQDKGGGNTEQTFYLTNVVCEKSLAT
jgi:hypothetical protein